jgi:predicted DNA-binding antitoxin AbrB/MazE fold protein
MTTIHATYENGVFRPREPVDLPENCVVEFEPRIVTAKAVDRQGVYDVLSRRFALGEADVAERHNEHQPC